MSDTKRDMSEADLRIVYLCDRKKCGDNHDCGDCNHTFDITHAINFKYVGLNSYIEVEKER